MTMTRLLRNLARNALHYAEEGEVLKAQACIEVIVFIRERGYDNIRGKLDFFVDNA
jgi:hypothetical protein